MENRRFLVAALLSLIVLMVWFRFLAPQPPVPEEPVGEEAGEEWVEEPAPGPGEVPPDDGTAFPAAPIPEEEAAPPPATEVIDFGAEVVAAQVVESAVIETDEIRAEFTNRGAQLVSFSLKNHLTAEGDPLELVRQRGSDPYPFALVDANAASHPLNDALYQWEEETDELGNPVLRFRHRSELGAVEKVFRWDGRGLLRAEIILPGQSGWAVLLGPGLRNLTPDEMDSRWTQRQAAYMRGQETDSFEPAKVNEEVSLSGRSLDWVGLEDSYVLAAAIPEWGLARAVISPVLQREEVVPSRPRFLPFEEGGAEEDLDRDLQILLQAQGERLELVTFLGVKRYSHLKTLSLGLETTVRWGEWLKYLALPLYYTLEWIYENVVANYGWSIIIVTFVIKLLFFPLTHKSQESMGKMQELNPKVQAIRAKYRPKLKDRQGRPNPEAQRKMNEEVMAVYKEAGVNPMSGCFPLLLQMPVFFAFYRLLTVAVELRGAPWLGWIQDLSVPDPLYILPLAMGGTSLAMQRMMPSSPDPMQRRMMQMMPIVFTVFAFAFPSGLVLYWTAQNLLTMVQQAALLKLKKRKAGEGAKGGSGDASRKGRGGEGDAAPKAETK